MNGDHVRKLLLAVALLCALTTRADEPRINRISPAAKKQAREVLAQALKSGGVAGGTAFAEIVQCGPRLWALIHEKFSPDDDAVLRTINLFDGERQAREWGFLLAPSVESDRERKAPAESMGVAAERTPIQMAMFRHGGEKRLGPHVARLLASPMLPRIRDASEAEIQYLWMLVPYDLQEPIFAVDVGGTRLLVTLDDQHKIDWVDVLPQTL